MAEPLAPGAGGNAPGVTCASVRPLDATAGHIETLRRALAQTRAKVRYLQDRRRAAPLPPPTAAKLVALRLEAEALRQALRQAARDVPRDDD